METLLEVRHLRISFRMYEKGLAQRDYQTVSDISATIRPGEILAIAGSSGSGKSLLAHAILRLLPYNASMGGEIFFRGELLNDRNIRALRGRRIALIPQAVTWLDPLRRARDQLKREKISREQRAELADQFRLSLRDLDKFPFQLSGGMARRILIAAALLSEADLLIADEPTPGLSEELAQDILGKLRDYAAQGKGVLLISHDIDLACQAADRLAVFHRGVLLDTLPVRDFLAGKPRHPFTRALWRALPQNGFAATPETEIAEECRRLGLPFPAKEEAPVC
ncbi:MAG: ATP-binding cassette domain-containing protein [Treponema sp.]|jgi:ABC-type glutathione transport system ATPase component|nr:ATP-binding cassette domain-containing protein [Treponema sp.]